MVVTRRVVASELARRRLILLLLARARGSAVSCRVVQCNMYLLHLLLHLVHRLGHGHGHRVDEEREHHERRDHNVPATWRPRAERSCHFYARAEIDHRLSSLNGERSIDRGSLLSQRRPAGSRWWDGKKRIENGKKRGAAAAAHNDCEPPHPQKKTTETRRSVGRSVNARDAIHSIPFHYARDAIHSIPFHYARDPIHPIPFHYARDPVERRDARAERVRRVERVAVEHDVVGRLLRRLHVEAAVRVRRAPVDVDVPRENETVCRER